MGRKLKLKQVELIDTDRPSTATVNGAGLKSWCQDTRVDVLAAAFVTNGTYKIVLRWKDEPRGVENAVEAKSETVSATHGSEWPGAETQSEMKF